MLKTDIVRGVFMNVGNVGTIDSIKFSILSPYMIKKMAAVKIDSPELYDPDGYPIDGGLMDLRLGVIDPGLRCKTCGGRMGTCPGHFGYLELTKPVIHPLFAKKIYQILKVTCPVCGRVMASEDDIAKKKPIISKLYKNPPKTCPHCGAEIKPIKFQKPTIFYEDNIELNPEQIRERLEKIPDRDLPALGISSRPEYMVLTVLPIPPVTVRPSIVLETGERSEDDLTHKLVDIVRINERLRKNIDLGAPEFIINDIWQLLQYHVSTYFNNEITNLPPARHRSGRALRTLAQRLTKKEGRFRGNLTGKRVNFCARSVISPDTMISINEVGIPEYIAKTLTVPEKVSERNIDEMRKVIMKGPNDINGANYVIRPDGAKKKIMDLNKEEIAKEITPGYTVERHIKDGDIVLFNRQPSLHRMSIMAHKARIMPYRTFRMNLCETIPYNADFDGDEMNLHVPQTEEARIEAEKLMLVENNIRSPRYGLPVIAFKHDHITGCYFLTNKDAKFSKEEVAYLLNLIGRKSPGKEMTGKELFSLLLPEDLNIEFISSTCVGCDTCLKDKCPYDSYVVIRNGKLIHGIIDESALGEKKGKLLNKIDMVYGHKRAAQFMDELSKLALGVLSIRGFTISITDNDINEKGKREMKRVLEKKYEEAKKLINDYNSGKLKKLSGMDERKTLEVYLQKIAAEISDVSGKIIRDSVNPESSSVIMAKTGARGSYVNLAQTSALVGQESLEGERINRGYTGRTTSHFKKDDLGLEAHGFVKGNYREGLNAIELFFDAVNSRENLMDKSLQTRHSGYMERRLVNALQDLRVEYDGTVRDNRGVIVEFTPASDSLDPSKIDHGDININLALEKIEGDNNE